MRIMKIILTDLTSDKLKAEENLENAINSTEDAYVKADKIKVSLQKIIDSEQMIVKWQEYLKANEQTNNDEG